MSLLSNQLLVSFLLELQPTPISLHFEEIIFPLVSNIFSSLDMIDDRADPMLLLLGLKNVINGMLLETAILDMPLGIVACIFKCFRSFTYPDIGTFVVGMNLGVIDYVKTSTSRIKGGWPGQRRRPEVIISKSCKQPVSFLAI